MDAMQNPSDPAGQLDLDSGIELQDDLEGDTLREECGVFGIFGHPDAAAITALGLHALQHRGQEAAGIVSFDGSRFHSERRLGLVGDTFSRREVIERLPGIMAPFFTSSRRSVSPLVRLPLCPTAKPPALSSANSGCTLRRMVSPVVE